ncbi:MAG: hypothetical protein NTW32_13770 [Chloroflexi bacterium]|nr:hypothetical protein [Chloroflexota bacterium]
MPARKFRAVSQADLQAAFDTEGDLFAFRQAQDQPTKTDKGRQVRKVTFTTPDRSITATPAT